MNKRRRRLAAALTVLALAHLAAMAQPDAVNARIADFLGSRRE